MCLPQRALVTSYIALPKQAITDCLVAIRGPRVRNVA